MIAITERAGFWVSFGFDEDGADLSEGFEGKGMFLIEIGSDDEKAIVIELIESLFEDLGPDGWVVPEVLVTEKG